MKLNAAVNVHEKGTAHGCSAGENVHTVVTTMQSKYNAHTNVNMY